MTTMSVDEARLLTDQIRMGLDDVWQLVNRHPVPGTRVRIERDETRYPSRGSWPLFRGRTGTVVEINEDRQRPHLTEYGIAFGKVWPRRDGRPYLEFSDSGLTWFVAHEIRRLAPVRTVGGRS